MSRNCAGVLGQFQSRDLQMPQILMRTLLDELLCPGHFLPGSLSSKAPTASCPFQHIGRSVSDGSCMDSLSFHPSTTTDLNLGVQLETPTSQLQKTKFLLIFAQRTCTPIIFDQFSFHVCRENERNRTFPSPLRQLHNIAPLKT